MVQMRVAGVTSVLPAASVARTLNQCWPTARPVYSRGEVHAANAAPSIEHSKSAAGSSAVNVKLALELVVVAGGAVPIVVSGAAVSILQVYMAGVASVFPAASVART